MSHTLLENRTTILEEMMVRLTGNVEILTENAQRSDKRLDKRLERLTENAEQSDKRLDRLSEKVERTTENLERLGKELRASHEEMRAERKAEQEEWNKRWDKLSEDREAEKKEWNKRWDKLSEDRKAEKKEWDKQWGRLSNKWGTMVEDLVGPSLPRLLREVAPSPPGNESMVRVRIRARAYHPNEKGKRFEMDGVVDSGKYALFCECKSKPKSADITKLIRKLGQAREYFPEYTNHHLLGAIAALHIESDLLQYASDKGILAFAVGKELMDVQNEPGFTPKHF
ncbi:MAG: hypothetical protein ACPGWR_30095 [Ardenticatenaceae bacterium]